MGIIINYQIVEIGEDFSDIKDPKERWEAYDIQDYVINENEFNSHFYSWSADVLIKQNKVVDIIESSITVNTWEGEHIVGDRSKFNMNELVTIDELFTLIYQLSKHTTQVLTVEYTPQYGYPTDIFSTDKDTTVMDSEYSFHANVVRKIMVQN